MKILMTTDSIGGVWTYSLELCKALQPYGVRVGLATMGKHLTTGQRRSLAALKHVSYFQTDYKLEWMEDPEEDLAEAGLWLQQVAYEYEPDVLHLNEYTFAGLGWYLPTVVVGHSSLCSWYWYVRRQVIGGEWDAYCQRVRKGLANADRVIAPSRTMLHWLLTHYGPIPDSQTIYNASEWEVGSPAQKDPFIFTAGRLWDEGKNIQLLGEIASRVAWPIYVAGDANHPEGSKINYPELRLMGKLSRAQMEHTLASTSIYALPARYEPFGFSVFAAARSACALVLSDLDSFYEIWGDAPIYASADDPEAWVFHLNRLIADPDLRRQVAHACQRRALDYPMERMAQEYLNVYQELLSQSVPDTLLKDTR